MNTNQARLYSIHVHVYNINLFVISFHFIAIYYNLKYSSSTRVKTRTERVRLYIILYSNCIQSKGAFYQFVYFTASFAYFTRLLSITKKERDTYRCITKLYTSEEKKLA